MKIAGLARRLGQPGGAEESMRTLFERLAGNHQAVMFGHAMSEPNWDGTEHRRVLASELNLPSIVQVPTAYLEFYVRFKRALERFRPSIIFAQHELALLGARQDTPQVLFLRDDSLLPSRAFEEDERAKRCANRLVLDVQERLFGSILHQSDVILANSHYTANQYRAHWNIDPDVIYPFIDVDQYRVDHTGDKILHVTPTVEKGIDVTLEVAKKMSDREFVVVGMDPRPSVRSRIDELPNVSFLGYVDDMTEVYRETGLVLMPSRWDEPFGRIPIEAGINGIPVLCSGKGGLEEAVGDERLVVESNTPDAYVTRVRAVENHYDEYALAVRANATQKTADTEIQKLVKTVEERLDVQF